MMKGVLLEAFVIVASVAGAADALDPGFDCPIAQQFSEVGGTAKSVSYRTMPSSWIVDDWHRLGVKVYLHLSPEEDESPELYRRRAGFQAFRSGVDGVRWGGSEADRAYFAPALAAADDDRALIGKLDALAVRAMESDNAPVRLAGRRERVYLQVAADFASAPSALIRRELVLRIRGLQKLFGEAPMAVPADIPDAPPRRFVAPKDVREVEAPVEFHPLKISPKLMMYVHGAGVGFTITGDRPIAKNEWPGVKRDYTLYVQGTNRTEWLAYKLSCDLTDRRGETGAAAPRVQFYTLEPRFSNTTGDRCRVRAMHLPAEGRPIVRMSSSGVDLSSCGGGSGRNWSFSFHLAWDQLGEVLPKRNSVWYLREGDSWLKIKWPNPVDGFSGLEFGNAFRRYDREVEQAMERWGADDAFFREACIVPLVDRSVGLIEMMKKKFDSHGYVRWSDADKFIKEKAAKDIRNVTLFARDLEAARIRYLDDVLAGREVKVPERKKAAEEKKPKGPSLDADEGGISLDDTEY